ncbi:Uncharacterised protein [uncultured archaeon]|nr:Uncharacterised protein [uncultured archaeon]
MEDRTAKRYYGDIAKKLSEKAKEVRLGKDSTQGEIASAYEAAGDAYILAGDKVIARQYYSNASRYAHDRKTENRIDDKLKGNFDIYEVKEKISHLTTSSLEKKAVEEPKKKKKKSSFWNMNINWDRVAKSNSPFETKEPRHYIFMILSIASLASALLFSASSMTGHAISSLTNEDSSWIGLCLFICCLIFTFIYIKQKDRF